MVGLASRGTVALLMVISVAFAGCSGGGDDGASPTPTGGTGGNMTAPKMGTPIIITAYDTPAPGQMMLMRLDPAQATGKFNETVNITFKVAAGQRGMHNLRIPDLGVTTQLDGVAVGGMKTVTVTLSTKSTGTGFRYYCNINAGATGQTSHDSLGMNGRLTVS